MTAPDPPASAGRRCGRALVAVALVTAGVLAPVSAPLLPGSPTHGSDAAVLAQSSVVGGMLDDCPTDRPGLERVGPEDRECEYETPACPLGPVTKEIMTPSVDDREHPDIINELLLVDNNPNKPVPLYRYPYFCEERMILAPVDGAAYDRAVFHIQPDEGQPARMIRLPVVAAGSNPCITETEIIARSHLIALETNADGDPLLDANGDLVLNASGMFGLNADGDPATVNMCRLLAQPQCADGLYRSDSNKCRWVTRRTWQCPTGTLPRNEFRTCYQPPPLVGGANPACGPGAPDMAALDCEVYVGNDYSRTPASLDCTTDFPTGLPRTALSANTLSGSAAIYWCEFDASHLKVDCHSNPPASDCAPTVARCLKRASETGGCSAVAATIRCRAEQAGALTAEQVQGSDCQPCVVLPFSPPPGPDDCPADEYSSEVKRPSERSNLYRTLHRVEDSFAVDHYRCRRVRAGGELNSDSDCKTAPVCDAADGAVPEGWLTWTSGHGSGLAIVNAPVVLTIEGLPGERLNRAHSKYLARGRGYEQPGDLSLSTTSYRAFDSDDVSDDPIIRIWPKMDSSKTYNWVSDYTSSEGPTCLLEANPDFMVTIQELHPDADSEEIEHLFGPSSLAWWDKLTADEQRDHIERRGLIFWDDLMSEADEDRESADRAAKLNEKVPCNFGADVVWCRWEPVRAGYFTATGGGAWLLSRLSTPRSWAFYEEGNSFLTIAYGNILQSLNNYLALYPGHFMSLFMEVNSELDNAIELSDLGLKMSGSKPQTDTENVVFKRLDNGQYAFKDNEWLYTEEVPVSLTCPSLDLRYLGCSETTTVGHYTKTEPIGIQVHEIRVTARTPNL